jgi:SsrA-binding protein
MAKKSKKSEHRIVAQNRKARHNYFIDETIEAGIELVGTEVKSLRQGKGSLVDAYAGEEDGELWMFNAYIPEYSSGGYTNHEPRRPRKLLLHRREIERLIGQIREKGVTLIPLSIYFNKRGIAKVDLGLARGKKQYDKRETEKKRDWQRQKERLIREMG